MLAKKYRLQRDRDFKFIYKKGRVVASRDFIVRFLPNRYQNSRLGIVISKKISNKATVRNRLKRQILAVFGDIIGQFGQNHDLVIGLRKMPEDDFSYLKTELINLCKKIRLI